MELQPLSSGSQGMRWNLRVCADFADFLTSGPSAARIPGSAQEQFAFYFSFLKIEGIHCLAKQNFVDYLRKHVHLQVNLNKKSLNLKI